MIAATLVMGTAMLGTIIAGDARERAALPAAADGVASAVGASGSLVSCFEGVQDDLYGAVLDDGTFPPEPAARALGRLATCDPGQLADRVTAIRLPARAPVTDPWHRELRGDITAAVAALDRAVVEARTAQVAFRRRIEGDSAQNREVAVAFRAVAAAYETARTIEHRIEATLRERTLPLGARSGPRDARTP